MEYFSTIILNWIKTWFNTVLLWVSGRFWGEVWRFSIELTKIILLGFGSSFQDAQRSLFLIPVISNNNLLIRLILQFFSDNYLDGSSYSRYWKKLSTEILLLKKRIIESPRMRINENAFWIRVAYSRLI